MNRIIDMEAILAPIPGDNPAGENLRYVMYDAIEEARREDDDLDRGEWKRELKTADWDMVITLATEALYKKSKDIQIAAWLLEGLVKTEGFQGLETGLRVISALLESYWENLYPEIDEEDTGDELGQRRGCLELINSTVSHSLKEIPITDPAMGQGYSLYNWQEAQNVGFEDDTKNQWGDVDLNKKAARDAKIAEGKITGENFESAVSQSSLNFYQELNEQVDVCLEQYRALENLILERFSTVDPSGKKKTNQVPALSIFENTLQECSQHIKRFFNKKQPSKPAGTISGPDVAEDSGADAGASHAAVNALNVQATARPSQQQVTMYQVHRFLGSGGKEDSVWQEALGRLQSEGIEPALELLLGAACSAQSVRERTNCRLLMAKLCLKANRYDLAKPIAEELNELITELKLELWESPIWIAEVIDALYSCLTAAGASDDDIFRAKGLLEKICKTDVTKAMQYGEK